MIAHYEHHVAIRKNHFCPFKFAQEANILACPCNWHKNIEILLITDGYGTLQYGADRYTLHTGDLAVINSGALHRVESERGIHYYYLIVDENFWLENGLDPATYTFERLFRDTHTEALFQHVAAQAQHHAASDDPLSTAMLRNAVLALLVELCTHHAAPKPPKPSTATAAEEYVKSTLDYINDNLARPLTLDLLAERCGITKYHLARAFKRYTGQTVFTYLNTLRCLEAELCIANGMSVTQAAFENGFDSLPYFSRTYKRLIGTSPSHIKPRA